MTDDEIKEKPAEVKHEETMEEVPAPAKKKKPVVVPSVHVVRGVTPENRPIQRVLVPVDHRAEFTHQERGRVVPLMRMETPADEPEKPLLRFSPPPDAPKGRMPAISRMPGRMPRSRMI
jgi:hypothetical protein